MPKLDDALQPQEESGPSSFQIRVEDEARENGEEEPGALVEDDEGCGCEDVLESVVAILDSLDEWQKSREGDVS